MKNVYAKVNAKGATVFYRDGKRISRASLTAAYVDEARAEMAIRGIDTTASGTKFLVEISLIVPVACDRWVGDRADISAVFTVNVGTVSEGVTVMAIARYNLDNFKRAIIYDAKEYADPMYDRWHMTRGAIILHSNGQCFFTRHDGLVYNAYVEETARNCRGTDVYLQQQRVQRAIETVERREESIRHAKELRDEDYQRLADAKEELGTVVIEHLKKVVA